MVVYLVILPQAFTCYVVPSPAGAATQVLHPFDKPYTPSVSNHTAMAMVGAGVEPATHWTEVPDPISSTTELPNHVREPSIRIYSRVYLDARPLTIAWVRFALTCYKRGILNPLCLLFHHQAKCGSHSRSPQTCHPTSRGLRGAFPPGSAY